MCKSKYILFTTEHFEQDFSEGAKRSLYYYLQEAFLENL